MSEADPTPVSIGSVPDGDQVKDTTHETDHVTDLPPEVDSQSSGETIYDSDDETTTTPKQEPIVFTEDEVILLSPNHEKLPNKLKHIKNLKFLNNTYNPLTGKYIKDVWAFKQTKLDRTKRDLIWTYFRYRKNKLAAQSLRESYYKNIKTVMIIHFDDPAQVKFELTERMVQILKHYCHEKEIKKPKKNKDKKNKKKEMIKQITTSTSSNVSDQPKDLTTTVISSNVSDQPKDLTTTVKDLSATVEPKPKPNYKLLREQKKQEKRERKLKEKMEGKVVKKGKPSKYAGRVKNTDKYNKKKILAKQQQLMNEQQSTPPTYNQPTPQPRYNQQTPQPRYNQPTPQPRYNQQTPHPRYNQQSVQSGYNQQTVQPGYSQQNNTTNNYHQSWNNRQVDQTPSQPYSYSRTNYGGYYPRNPINNNQYRSNSEYHNRHSSQDNYYPRPYPRQPNHDNQQTSILKRPPRHDGSQESSTDQSSDQRPVRHDKKL